MKGLVPWLSKGAAYRKEVSEMAGKLSPMCQSKPDCLGPVTSCALDELSDICEYFRILTSPELAGTEGSVLTRMKEAKSGVKVLVRKAVSGSSYWSAVEQEIRRTELAEKSLGPELYQLCTAVGAGKWPAVLIAIKQLPVFKDQLRAEKVEVLSKAVKLAIKSEAESPSATPAALTVAEAACRDAVKALKDPEYEELACLAKARLESLREADTLASIAANLAIIVDHRGQRRDSTERARPTLKEPPLQLIISSMSF